MANGTDETSSIVTDEDARVLTALDDLRRDVADLSVDRKRSNALRRRQLEKTELSGEMLGLRYRHEEEGGGHTGIDATNNAAVVHDNQVIGGSGDASRSHRDHAQADADLYRMEEQSGTYWSCRDRSRRV